MKKISLSIISFIFYPILIATFVMPAIVSYSSGFGIYYSKEATGFEVMFDLPYPEQAELPLLYTISKVSMYIFLGFCIIVLILSIISLILTLVYQKYDQYTYQRNIKGVMVLNKFILFIIYLVFMCSFLICACMYAFCIINSKTISEYKIGYGLIINSALSFIHIIVAAILYRVIKKSIYERNIPLQYNQYYGMPPYNNGQHNQPQYNNGQYAQYNGQYNQPQYSNAQYTQYNGQYNQPQYNNGQYAQYNGQYNQSQYNNGQNGSPQQNGYQDNKDNN